MAAAWWMAVQPRRARARDGSTSDLLGDRERCRVDWQEKLIGEEMRAPYRKPTQVGKASSLRCTSETWSRNSA